MSLPQPIRVVGCGSPHGADAVGWEVVRLLDVREGYSPLNGVGRSPLPPGVELHRARGGADLLDLLDGRGTLLLIDAAVSCDAPAGAGNIVALEWPDERIATTLARTTHDLGPAAALRLADALGVLPERIVVFAVLVDESGAATWCDRRLVPTGRDETTEIRPAAWAAAAAVGRLLADQQQSPDHGPGFASGRK